MTSSSDPTVTVYGAPWCPHCKRVKKFLAAHRVPYDVIDLDEDPKGIERLKALQDGGQIIPTVVYADGTHDVNPSDETLASRIGLTLGAERSAYDLVIVGGGPAGLAAAITRHKKASMPSSSTPVRWVAKPASATGSTTTQASPRVYPEPNWPNDS